jgi:hypothetical protein
MEKNLIYIENNLKERVELKELLNLKVIRLEKNFINNCNIMFLKEYNIAMIREKLEKENKLIIYWIFDNKKILDKDLDIKLLEIDKNRVIIYKILKSLVSIIINYGNKNTIV